MDIDQEIANLKERNARVEADKAWETSGSRKALVLFTTYLIASLALWVIGVEDFYLGAIIPTVGFFLSTLTFPAIKKIWVDGHIKRNRPAK